ncbi:MAG: 16S rRNA (cytidine(1402)-2'-O)-methyltransferase [Phycisphaerales bacterium]|nr:16S rRNA (cytidine(1402)-2'-O)-methyltransferase [Phycisphaerales bacterium]
MLYLIPTPIGNLQDITLRALDTLRTVDFILCEDTRTSQKLLNHFQIHKPLSPYHQHNEHQIIERLLQQLQEGKKIALITDAGTPGISDPSFLLIRACIAHKIPFENLPGATAFVPALLNSGLPAHEFTFIGFLPLKKGRHTELSRLATITQTMLFYESPLRLLRTLTDFIKYFGAERQASVSREMTKMFEETQRGSLVNLESYFSKKVVRGEIVIVVEGLKSGSSNELLHEPTN